MTVFFDLDDDGEVGVVSKFTHAHSVDLKAAKLVRPIHIVEELFARAVVASKDCSEETEVRLFVAYPHLLPSHGNHVWLGHKRAE